jgi:hypothetical protein
LVISPRKTVDGFITPPDIVASGSSPVQDLQLTRILVP